MVDFAKARRRSAIEARFLERTAWMVHAQHGKRKAAEIGAMRGTIVELGPGTGVNMRYYEPGVRVIAIEPNPAMHPYLRDAAEQHEVDLEIRTLRGESIDLDDQTADAVVSTLVLCGVDDPTQVVNEIIRISKPGAPFFFLEHVVSPTSGTRLVQRLVRPAHRWMFNGCEVDRDTASLLQHSGLDDVVIDRTDGGWRGAYIRHQIIGTARTPQGSGPTAAR